MNDLVNELAARLENIKAAGLHREMKEPEGLDFSSNDYLGLSRHPSVRAKIIDAIGDGPLGAPASRLLRGTFREHLQLEERLATFKGAEAALLFPSGYQANLAVLTALMGPGDLAVSDERNHASIIDGIRLSGARKAIYPHLDLGSAERALRENARSGRAFLITESLFSMDGDRARLDECAAIAERRGAALIVDDSHASGLYGSARGSGLCEEFGIESRVAAVVTTFGKAFGLCGAFCAGPRVIVDYLINKARPFIFSTAVPPLLLAAIEAALDVASEEPELRSKALALASRLRTKLGAAGIDCLRSCGPIVPVVLGENERALGAAEAVRRRGFDVRAVRPPSVPPGTARLRISVHADHTEAQVDRLAEAIQENVCPRPLVASP